MYYIGLDVHKKTISYCVKDASGQIQRQGTIGATRNELDLWMKYLPQPWTVAMEATIFTGWIYDHLLPHAAQVKVAHQPPRRRTTGSMPARLRTACGAISCPSAIWLPRRFGIGAAPCAIVTCWYARWFR
jgi:transposase